MQQQQRPMTQLHLHRSPEARVLLGCGGTAEDTRHVGILTCSHHMITGFKMEAEDTPTTTNPVLLIRRGVDE